MDRLKAAEALQAIVRRADEEARRGAAQDPARQQVAEQLAERLLAQLAPLFPSIGAATRDDDGASAWKSAWARQIEAAALQPAELATGLKNIAGVMQAARHPPITFPLFLQACRPQQQLTGQDAEARKRHPLLLIRDLKTDREWCSSRDTALARLRAMGYCNKP